jgi:hypothetical protein
MKDHSIRFNACDQHLIDITCIYPDDAIEAFAFMRCPSDKMEVSTVTRERFDKWVDALESGKCEFQIVNGPE